MCGIAGIMNLFNGDNHQAGPLQNMLRSMHNRGPDDEGSILINADGKFKTYFGDDTPYLKQEFQEIPYSPQTHITSAFSSKSAVSLGHRRLSIVDLTPNAHQPMSSSNGRYWMVYNGEIYNFAEIAKQLRSEGVQLRGKGDSEVLINAYATWGEKCLNRFNGMFAFAIWDNNEKVLFCGRDRIGIKPFYYTIQNKQFIFASDIKAIISSGCYLPVADMRGLYLAMTFGVAPRPMTSFKNVFALEQAHWMRVHSDGRIEKKRYWSIPTGTQKHNMTEKEAVDLVEEQLTESIKRRLISDVPVGTFMSGGVDSTLISSIASKTHCGIKAFTLGYESSSPEMDEVPQAVATAKLHPIDHIVKIIDVNDALLDMNARLDCYEDPGYALGANYDISKLVKSNNIKVVLNGLGGDELFAGYSYYGLLKYRKILKILKPAIGIVKYFQPRKGRRLSAIASASSPDRLHSIVRSKNSHEVLSSLFETTDNKDFDSTEYLRELYVGDIKFEDDVEAMSYMDLMNYVGNHHVHRLDQFTMAHSLECRFPFFDHKVVEAAFTIPSRLKLKGKIHKYVLRKVAQKYIAPECLSMQKKGFGLPLGAWMKGPLKELVKIKLQNLQERPKVNPAIIEQQYKSYLNGNLSSGDIWHLVALEFWFERFIDGNSKNYYKK